MLKFTFYPLLFNLINFALVPRFLELFLSKEDAPHENQPTKDYPKCDCVSKHISLGVPYLLEDRKWTWIELKSECFVDPAVSNEVKSKDWTDYIHEQGCIARQFDIHQLNVRQ